MRSLSSGGEGAGKDDDRSAYVGVMRDMIWAVLRMRRMSLNDGGTNLREEIALRASSCLNADSNARGVKKVEMLGTSMDSLDRTGSPGGVLA